MSPVQIWVGIGCLGLAAMGTCSNVIMHLFFNPLKSAIKDLKAAIMVIEKNHREDKRELHARIDDHLKEHRGKR